MLYTNLIYDEDITHAMQKRHSFEKPRIYELTTRVGAQLKNLPDFWLSKLQKPVLTEPDSFFTTPFWDLFEVATASAAPQSQKSCG